MNFLTHDNGTFLLWESEPIWNGSGWVSTCGETPAPTDKRTAERMMRRKAHLCECYDLKLKTATIIHYMIKTRSNE